MSVSWSGSGNGSGSGSGSEEVPGAGAEVEVRNSPARVCFSVRLCETPELLDGFGCGFHCYDLQIIPVKFEGGLCILIYCPITYMSSELTVVLPNRVGEKALS